MAKRLSSSSMSSVSPLLKEAHAARLFVSVHAKRPEDTSTSYRQDGSDDHSFTFQFRESKVTLSKQSLAISGLGLLGLAAFIGPVIFGLIFASVSIVLASLGGALALSTMFIPLVIFSVFFVLIPFGSVAFLGLSFIAPTFLQLFLTGSAMALGWWAMTKLLVKPDGLASSRGQRPELKRKKAEDQTEIPKTKSYDEQEMERASNELKEFDNLLQERERNKRGRG